MAKVHMLDQHTINQIAAGEVIENPSSIVKELVENSLDAGATEISISIRVGGRELIVVSDNGCGMSKEDALLCLQRHATSKINRFEDLEQVFTLGFRGEAIPSISSVSQFQLLTSDNDQGDATLVQVNGGKDISVTSAARTRGTTIEVRSLFFNVPVRRNFQRSVNYDTNEVYRTVANLALGNPSIRFEFFNNEEVAYSLSQNLQGDEHQKLANRIVELMGIEFFDALRPVDITEQGYRFWGFIGTPNFVKHNRTGQYFFVNGRTVVIPLLSNALKEAYGTRISQQKFPVCILHIEVPAQKVDVNVHPQKREIRLQEDSKIRQLFIQGIERSLSRGYTPVNLEKVEEKPFAWDLPAAASQNSDFSLPVMPEKFQKEHLACYKEMLLDVPNSLNVVPDPVPMMEFPKPTVEYVAEPMIQAAPPVEKSEALPLEWIQPQVIGKYKNYLLIDMASVTVLPPYIKPYMSQGILILDLVGAKMRILFENLLNNSSENINSQKLLLPLIVEFTPLEVKSIEHLLEDLQNIGIEIRLFGEEAFIIDALPQYLPEDWMHTILSEMVESASSLIALEKLQQQRKEAIALAIVKSLYTTAKKHSITEESSLLNALMGCKNPYENPLGKPLFTVWESDELDKKFRRFS